MQARAYETSVTPWLPGYVPGAPARVRLFCFPYAGGASTIFTRWRSRTYGDVEVCPVELPGRGARLREAPFAEMPALVEALAGGLRPYLVPPYAFFGHSMGARIAFHLAAGLASRGEPMPGHLFVSGSAAPHAPRRHPSPHTLSDAALIEHLRGMGGTPGPLLRDPEFLAIFLPVLRADFAVDDAPCPTPTRLDCPISAFGGIADESVPPEALEMWSDCTASRFSRKMLPGGHFFLHAAHATLVSSIKRDIEDLGVR
jgi:medium-chain acyl-[acyl-carrier-protein] hydrolase